MGTSKRGAAERTEKKGADVSERALRWALETLRDAVLPRDIPHDEVRLVLDLLRRLAGEEE